MGVLGASNRRKYAMTMPESMERDDNRDGIAITGASDTLPKYIIGTPPTIESLRKRRDDAASDPNGRGSGRSSAAPISTAKGSLAVKCWPCLELRKQPQIYTNRVRPAVNGVLGVLENARSDPQAYPRNPGDQDSADVVTKVLRFVADQSDFGDIKQDVAENFLIEGTGACIIEMDGEDIVPTQIRWEEFYCDRYARRNDRKDARFMGIAKWVDVDTVNKQPALERRDRGIRQHHAARLDGRMVERLRRPRRSRARLDQHTPPSRAVVRGICDRARRVEAHRLYRGLRAGIQRQARISMRSASPAIRSR
jgi:hypothetical protein